MKNLKFGEVNKFNQGHSKIIKVSGVFYLL